MNTNKILMIAFLLTGSIGFSGCEDDILEEVTTLDVPRAFSPTELEATIVNRNNVRLNWRKVSNADSYTIELFTNTDMSGSPSKKVDNITFEQLPYTVSGLNWDTNYSVRVKANGADIDESKWVSATFKIDPQQIFSPVISTELRDKSVVLRWESTATPTKIVLTPATGSISNIDLTPEEISAHFAKINGLSPLTAYKAEIFENSILRGTLNFTTPEPSEFTVVLTQSENLISAVNSAAAGDVIGLEAGTYTLTENLIVAEKHITIQSVSGNPADTKVNFKEITVAGNSAGVTLKGIEFDGKAANAAYFINFVGYANNATSDATAATFSSVIVDNCNVHNIANCLVRGNRAANAAHKVDMIKFTNSKFYDISPTASYVTFTLDKLEFKTLELSNSTFYNIGRTLIAAATVLPSGAAKPIILIDKCTFNNWGSSVGSTSPRNYLILDANANPVDFTLKNSILANSPVAGDVIGNAALRASASTISITNNNIFKLTNGASPAVDLTFPSDATPVKNRNIDLGWTATTTDFSLPASSELRSASTSGGPVGDPRWAK